VSPDEEMPKRFGKYTLIRRIAVGGMAEIFLGIQRSMAGFEKLIVIKRVLPKLAEDKEFVNMLLDEARIAATLNHPNVAHIYDVGVNDGQYFIAMEHVHGEDIRSIVRQMKKKGVTSFPIEHGLAIVLGCCAGLAYAHEKRDLDGQPMDIVHRDVSPQNILVTFSGDVKLVDFGIAKAGRTPVEESKSGKLKGKIPYMSPEQAQGLELDARSDVFSLGVMLFELCTGRRLFKGTSEYDTMRLIVEGDYPRPRTLNPNMPPRLEEIILRALAKDRDQRYQSAREFQSDLESFIRAERLAVSPLSLGEWMQGLFSEKLEQQKQMLQEGRQLAEVIAAQIAEEEAEAAEALRSGVHQRKASKVPWILLVLVILGAIGTTAWFLTRPPRTTGPPTGPGVLEITSDPPGAAIWLDGDRRSERTPATLRDLPVGATYTVKLTADGFAPGTTQVRLTEDEPTATIEETLERPSAADFAVINVRTVPAGATILLDGEATEQVTPATIPQILPGVEHTLALALEGYVTRSVDLTLSAGQVEDLAFDLEPTPLTPNEAILRITTVPSDSRILVDGEWYETGSPYQFRRQATPLRVVVARSGFRNEERTIDLPGGETTAIEVRLRRRSGGGASMGMATMDDESAGGPGALTFDARPWCQVSIDGRSVGQTPIVNRSLPAGNHTVRCVNPELGVTRNVTVDIRPGQTTRQRIHLQ
jgi:serine/threonine-protein kinase